MRLARPVLSQVRLRPSGWKLPASPVPLLHRAQRPAQGANRPAIKKTNEKEGDNKKWRREPERAPAPCARRCKPSRVPIPLRPHTLLIMPRGAAGHGCGGGFLGFALQALLLGGGGQAG